MHWHKLDWAFVALIMRAVKAQASLCNDINSTETSLLQNTIRTKFPDFLSHFLSGKCSGKIYIITGLPKLLWLYKCRSCYLADFSFY